MLAHHGYSDASGDYFITVDTRKCDGCGECAGACPAQVLEVSDEDPNDPFREEPIVAVREDKKQKIKYECGPCKPASNRPPLPCVEACPTRAISHSW